MVGLEDHIITAVKRIQLLVDAEFAKCSGDPPSGNTLDQCGLKDGAEIVMDYVLHDEAGIALEHLLYMVEETGVPIEEETLFHLQAAANAMGMERALSMALENSNVFEQLTWGTQSVTGKTINCLLALGAIVFFLASIYCALGYMMVASFSGADGGANHDHYNKMAMFYGVAVIVSAILSVGSVAARLLRWRRQRRAI